MEKFHSHKKLAILFIAPQLILTFVFFIWPAVKAVKQSFYFSDAFGLQAHFALWHNYFDLFHDPAYGATLKASLLLGICITFLAQTLGMLLAYCLSLVKKYTSFYQSLLLWPYAVAPAVAAMLWRFLFQPELGWVAQICHFFGYEFNYLVHAHQAFLTLIIAATWQQFSYNFLFYYAALQSVPSMIIDAAKLDGASSWRCFWQIQLPLVAPTTLFLMIVNLIYAFFETFSIIDILTAGGPGTATASFVYKIYKDGFVGLDPSSAATQSVILMGLVGILTLLQFRYLDKRIHYS